MEIVKHQRIAQIVMKKISHPHPQQVSSLPNTVQGHQGFGSTEGRDKHISTIDRKPNIDHPAPVTIHAIDNESFGIEFSNDPFDNVISMKVDNKGDHPTQGLDVQMNEKFERLQLIACNKGTPAGRIERWRSTIKNGFLLAVNEQPVNSETQLQQAIRECNDNTFDIRIGMVEKQALHPQTGVPHLYFDQMHQLGKHLFALRYDPQWMSEEHVEEGPVIAKLRVDGIVPKGRRRGARLTRRKLMLQSD